MEILPRIHFTMDSSFLRLAPGISPTSVNLRVKARSRSRSNFVVVLGSAAVFAGCAPFTTFVLRNMIMTREYTANTERDTQKVYYPIGSPVGLKTAPTFNKTHSHAAQR
uniref:Uncharacterized protein n=1 Tax=Trichogramma kaykai TaxID=54128 RepID=A0ABD2XBC2_9HYME